MPWLSILLALLTFFTSKASGASNTKALVTAGLAGAGSYYVTHETDWGKANLGQLDGVIITDASANSPIVDSNGNPVLDESGTTMVAPIIDGVGSNITDVLKSWGGAGTAAVIGTTAAASNGLFSSANLPWLLGGIALLLVMK